MPKMKLDGFITAYQSIVDGMNAAKADAVPKLHKVLKDWAQNTAKDAERTLNRPTWLLSRNIASKVKEYADGAKIWAMAGFKFSKKDDKRTPGYYGQFHEAGWLPNNRKPKAPAHFLRTAKQKNMATLKTESEKALNGIIDTIREEMTKKKQK